MQNVTPKEAAMVLCRLNPLKDEDPERIYVDGDETSPHRYRLLLRVFEGVASTLPKPRMLVEWRTIAQQHNLRYHSWIDDYADAIEARAAMGAPAEEGVSSKAGLSKSAILAVEWPLHNKKFTQKSLETALGDVPNWLEFARVGPRGAAGRGKGSHQWNPAMLADCLAERGYAPRVSLERLLKQHFAEWLEDWQKMQEYRTLNPA